MIILKPVCSIFFLKGSETWAIDRFNGLFDRAHTTGNTRCTKKIRNTRSHTCGHRAAYGLNLEETL